MADTKKSATLSIDGKEYDLPIYSPTAGPDVLDIRKLYAQAGVFTYEPGFIQRSHLRTLALRPYDPQQ